MRGSPIGLLLGAPHRQSVGELAEGGGGVLGGETIGAGFDFTHPKDSKRIMVKNQVQSGLASYFTNGSTSPKLVYDSTGRIVWAPHNRLKWSEDFTQPAAWAPYQCTITANAIAAPNGTMTADKIVGTGLSHYVYQPTTAVPGGATFSVYAKAGEVTGLMLQDYEGLKSDCFDLVAGTIVVPPAEAGLSTGKATIEAVGNGWYRCSIPLTPNGASPTLYLRKAFTDFVTDTTIPAGQGAYWWGAQVNRGGAPTAYVPTTTAAAFGLAIDCDPYTHGGNGLLCEPASTNVLVWSTDMSNPAWYAGGGLTPNAELAPNGRMEGAKCWDNSSGFIALMGGIPGSITGNISIYAKAAELTELTLAVGSPNVTDGFDLVTGQTFVVTQNGVPQPTSGTARMEYVGNGWWRCSSTVTNLSDFMVGPSVNRDFIWAPRPGHGIFLWGPQAETGSPAASSYIPTYAASVTRADDLYTIVPTAINYSGTAGSWWADVNLSAVINTSRIVGYQAGDNTPVYQANATQFGCFDGASNTYSPTVTSTLGNHKVATAFASADRAISADGLAPALNTTAGVALLTPGASIRFNGIHGHIRGVCYVPRRMTNAQLQNKTTASYANAIDMLAGEPYGWAVDFTDPFDNKRCVLNNGTVESGLDAFFTNTSGSPKQVYDVTGTLTWSPHNLSFWSEDFSNAAWVKGGCTVAGNAIVAPNGTTTADKFVENAAGASKFLQQVGPRANDGTFSVYAKAGERSKIVLQDFVRGSVGDGFDLIAGTVYALNIPTLTSTGKARIEPVGDGWYRCSIGVVTGGDCCLYLADNNWIVSYTGDGVSGLYVWGAQLNYGPALLPYLATTTTVRAGLAIDYDPQSHACKGLLCEPAATNVQRLSTNLLDPGTAVWWPAGCTVIPNATVAPNGALEGFRLAGTGDDAMFGDGIHSALLLAGAIPGNVTGCLSIYAKADTCSQFCLFSSANNAEGFDLLTGTTFVPLSDGTPMPTGSGRAMQYVGNGWWRCSVTATAVGDFWLQACANRETAFAVGTKMDLFLWGPQAENGPSLPSSYIPTYAAAVTRAADTYAITPAQINYSATAGSWLADMEILPGSNNGRIIGYGAANTPPLYIQTDQQIALYDTTSLAKVVASTLGRHKSASAFKASDRAITADGLAPATDTGATAGLLAPAIIEFGMSSGASINGYFRRAYYLPRRQTNTELQAKTI